MGFFDDLKRDAAQIKAEWEELWQAAGAGPLEPGQAQHTLDVLWRRSHLDILEHSPGFISYFPTRQKYTGRLDKVAELWWVDHATAGINGWGTLKWFSSEPRAKSESFTSEAEAKAYAKQKGGTVSGGNGKWIVSWKGLAGASTHFVIFPDGRPFQLIQLNDGCWGEPKRNGDGIHVEMVNALVVNPKGQGWNFWAGSIPAEILAVQPPVDLDRPFKGAHYMLPYTWDQVIANIKLKRLCIAATEGRMALDRMSQHTDWRESKFDMGPLWPFDTANKVAYEPYDVESYGFIQAYVKAPGVNDVVDVDELEALKAWAADPDRQFEGQQTGDGDTSIDDTKEVQQALIKLYGPACLPKYGADGSMGAETSKAVKQFQLDWVKTHPQDKIKVDGIPGVQTCARLEKAVAGDTAFKVS